MNLSVRQLSRPGLAAWALFIVYMSLRPTPESIPDWPQVDKVLHAGGYALLGALFYWSLEPGWRQSPWKLAALAGLACGVYGGLLELVQYFVPYRSAEFLDILADWLGGLAGAAGALILSAGK